MRLSRSKSHHYANLYIVVHTINISKAMMNHVMFDIPHNMTSSKHTHRIACNFILPLLLTKAAIASIMHNIEANCCYQPSHYCTLNKCQIPYRLENQQMQINKNKQRKKQDGLKIKLSVSCLFYIISFEIDLYSIF